MWQDPEGRNYSCERRKQNHRQERKGVKIVLIMGVAFSFFLKDFYFFIYIFKNFIEVWLIYSVVFNFCCTAK